MIKTIVPQKLRYVINFCSVYFLNDQSRCALLHEHAHEHKQNMTQLSVVSWIKAYVYWRKCNCAHRGTQTTNALQICRTCISTCDMRVNVHAWSKPADFRSQQPSFTANMELNVPYRTSKTHKADSPGTRATTPTVCYFDTNKYCSYAKCLQSRHSAEE